MERHTVQLLRESWARLADDSVALADLFYQRLLEAHPQQARLFANTDLGAQRRKFADMLDEIVRVVGEPQELVPVAGELGRRHAEYRVSEADYGPVGEILLEALGERLGPGFTPELREAWREGYTLLAHLMLRGARRTPPPA